jgi:signal transduction histidine kinase
MNEPQPPTIDPATAWARALADVQHDLRTHAGAAKMWLELLDRARDEEERARAARLLRVTLDDFVRLAEDLQDAAQAVAPRSEPEPPQAFDLAQCFRSAGEVTLPRAEFRNIDLVVDADGVGPHVIVGDANAWRRTFLRLIEAALHCCPRRETLVARFHRQGAATEVALPAPGLELPPDGELRQVWAESRARTGMTFARGLWLARRHLVDEGGGLALRDTGEESGGRILVATLPPATGG